MEKKTIITSSGKVVMKNNQWEIVPDMSSKDIRILNYTDRNPYDCAIIRHNSKYGFFYVSDMTPIYYGNINPPLVSFDKKDPFPFDEIVLKWVACHDLMIIGYRIGNKWGIDNISYGIHDGVLIRWIIVPCNYSSLFEAESQCLSWIDPFKL